MRLRPLQGTTQQGPLVQPEIAFPPDGKPSETPKRIIVPVTQGPSNPPKRIPGSSKGEPSNAGLSSNSHGVLRPFDASARASPLNPGLPHRVGSTHRVSHPHGGLLLARTPGLVSCRKRPWGFALQGLTLTTRSCSSSPQKYPLGVPPGSRTVNHSTARRLVQQASQPAGQTIRRPQGFAPAVNPYRGRTFTSETQRPIPS
jgi:hypothetical protein